MRKLYYDTVLYSKDSLELLFKTVGVDRCLFGTERPGVGTVKDPHTGRWLDETRFTIEAIRLADDGGQEDDLRGQREEGLQPQSNASPRRPEITKSVIATCPMHRRFVAGGRLACAWPPERRSRLSSRRRSPSTTRRAAASQWPMYMAKEGGYYQKYGLDVRSPVRRAPGRHRDAGSGQAAMVNTSLEQGMVAGVEGRVDVALIGSSLEQGTSSR